MTPIWKAVIVVIFVIPGQHRVYPAFLCLLKIYTLNRLYKYLKENNILYEKQFGFSKKSTNDATIQLIDKIFYHFQKKTVHSRSLYWFVKGIWYISSFHLTEKTKTLWHNYKNLALFESYLSNRKQYVHIGENSNTDLKYVPCGFPRGSILGPILFLVYVNNLPNAYRLLDPIMLAMILIFSLIIRTLTTSLQL